MTLSQGFTTFGKFKNTWGEARAYETVCCEDLALTRHILYDFFQFSTIVVHDPSEILGKSRGTLCGVRLYNAHLMNHFDPMVLLTASGIHAVQQNVIHHQNF